MRYESKRDLPSTIQDVLPERAQEIYLRAYQRAWEEYKEPERVGLSREMLAHQQGWNAVKQVYVQDQGTGEWRLVGE
jgi:cation transport regulator